MEKNKRLYYAYIHFGSNGSIFSGPITTEEGANDWVAEKLAIQNKPLKCKPGEPIYVKATPSSWGWNTLDNSKQTVTIQC